MFPFALSLHANILQLSNVEYDTGYITFSIPGGQRKLNAESASNVKDSNGTGPDASSATTQDETKLEHGTAQPTITKSETESMVESSTVQLNNASSRVEDIPDAEVLETITVRPTTAPKADSEAHTKTPASTRFLSPPPSDRPVQKRYLSRTNQRSVSEIHEEHKKAKKATELARLVNQPTIHPLPDFLAVSSSGYSLRSTRRSTEKDDPITPDTKSLSVLAKPDSGSSRQVSTASELVAPVTERLDSLEALEKRIHAIDGRPAYVRSYKPWTSFNIIRGGIDIGTLENLRREYMRTLLLNI